MGRLQLMLVVAAIAVWSCRAGGAAKACGKSSKGAGAIDNLPPPKFDPPPIKSPAIKGAPAAGAVDEFGVPVTGAADDFAAPVDQVGKAAALDEGVATPGAAGSRGSKAAGAGDDGIGASDVIETAVDGVSEVAGDDDE